MENLSALRTDPGVFPSTKLRAPRLPNHLYPLGELYELVERALDKNSLILAAPAGCGKTSLVAAWERHARQSGDGTPTSVSWVRLDADDSDYARFCSLLLAGLEAFVPDVRQQFCEVLGDGGPDAVPSALVVAIERAGLPAACGRNVLVLDNFEAASNGPVDRLVSYLIAYMPAGYKLVVCSQVAPSLSAASPVPDFDGMAALVTAEKLVLDEEEATGFLRFSLGEDAGVSESILGTAVRAAGGRLPALNVAARCLAEARPRMGEVPDSAACGRLSLLDELLAALSERERDLLVKTSFLDLVSPPLCDDVLEAEGCEGVLASIAAKTGVLVTVDGKRRWYKAQGPWPQYLQSKFRKLDRAEVRGLCKRASAYLKNHNHVGQAIDCLCKAALWDELEDLVGEHHLSLMFDNRFDVFGEVLSKLPRHVLESSPKLSIAQAWVLAKAGSVEESVRFVKMSESLTDADSPDASQLKAERLAVLSLCCGHSGDIRAGKDMVAELLSCGQGDPGVLASLVYNAAGCIVAREKEPARVVDYLENCLEVAAGQGNRPACSVLCYFAARQRIDAGDLRSAEKTAWRARDGLGFSSMDELEVLPEVIEATVMRKRGEFARAEEAYSRCLGSLGPSSGIEFFAEAGCGLALALRSQGRMGEAADTARSILQLCDRSHAERPRLIALVYLAMIEIDAGNIDQAADHVRALRGANPASADLIGDLIALALARFRFASGQVEEAGKSLDRLAGAFEESGRYGLLLSALVAKGMVLYAQGLQGPSSHAVLRALELARDTGEIEAFVNEGFSMTRLLGGMRERRLVGDGLDALAQRITQEIADLNIPEPAWRLERRDRSPLTAREREVCELLALGYSNRQIAESLCVSINTVDTHRKRIYLKLGVNNRKDLVEKIGAAGGR